MAKNSMPKEIYVYVCDKLEDGTPVYAVASHIEEIPEDTQGQRVGTYSLKDTHVFKVTRILT